MIITSVPLPLYYYHPIEEVEVVFLLNQTWPNIEAALHFGCQLAIEVVVVELVIGVINGQLSRPRQSLLMDQLVLICAVINMVPPDANRSSLARSLILPSLMFRSLPYVSHTEPIQPLQGKNTHISIKHASFVTLATNCHCHHHHNYIAIDCSSCALEPFVTLIIIGRIFCILLGGRATHSLFASIHDIGLYQNNWSINVCHTLCTVHTLTVYMY